MANLNSNTRDSIELGSLQLDEVLDGVLDDFDDFDGILDTVVQDDSDEGPNAGTEIVTTASEEHHVKQKEARQKALQETNQMIDDLDIIEDIDELHDEEKENDLYEYKRAESMLDDDTLDVEEREEIQSTIDEAVMMLLSPDYFTIKEKVPRMEMLRKHMPAIKGWSVDVLDESVVGVAESMSFIHNIHMYDTQMMGSKKYDKFQLREVDLSMIKEIPKKYFMANVGDNDGGSLHATNSGLDDDGDAEYDDFDTIDLDFPDQNRSLTGGTTISTGVAKTLKKIGKHATGKSKGSKIVCAGCGLRLKFKAKHRDRDNFVAFQCERTNQYYVFHDHLCVTQRKIKESIRMYVFNKEKEEHPDEEEIEQNAFINIDLDFNMKSNWRSRPRHFTTPRRGDYNYKDDENDDGEYSKSDTSKNFLEYADTGSIYIFGNAGDAQDKKDMMIKHGNFRRYRMQVETIMRRFMRRKKGIKISYKDRFNDLPKILVFSDLSEFGVAIWEFVSEALKSKQRDALWIILRFLALEMPTNAVLDLLRRHTHLLTKHMLPEYDEVCQAAMEGSKHPIAMALRLSAFMYERARLDLSNSKDYDKMGDQYVMIARKLLKEIESDHLFAMLLHMPTDLAGQSIAEIALKYNLTHFLEDPRIVRVFGVMWFGGYDFLDPGITFQDHELAFPDLYQKLVRYPGRFYFSPVGKFYTSSILYMVYLALFSYVTYEQIYDYTATQETTEFILWGCSFGYVTYEFVEFFDGPGEYFSSMTNYWDIIIAINWCILAYLRFVYDHERVYDDSGQLDEVATRNLPSTEVYMGVWAAQCVLLWSRVASLFQTSRSAGPLIVMITKMLKDIGNFFLICIVFFVGISFAAYYIIGGDLEAQKLSAFTSVSFYVFKTLIGQQTWVLLDEYVDEDGTVLFDVIRSNMVISIIVVFSIFGTILLLNLLIAMMASSYESVKRLGAMELNKQIIDKTFELDRSRAIIAPPMNVIAYLFYVYWFAFEIIAWVLTFGHRQFNEEYWSPLNRGPSQYTQGDRVKFRKANRKIWGVVKKKTPILDRLAGAETMLAQLEANKGRKTQVNPPMYSPQASNTSTSQDTMDDSVVWDLQVYQGGKTYDLHDKDVLKVKKSFFRRRATRVPSVAVENYYCRFCRFNLSDDQMNIQYYLNLFEMKGQHIDPDDKKFMKSLLASADLKYNIPNPKACELCPNCYRPYKVLKDGSRDVMIRRMYILEIVSYMVFRIFVWPLLIIIFFIPANLAAIKRWLSIKLALSSDDDDEMQMSESHGKERKIQAVINRSESNDDYRNTVRQVSKQEEGTNQMVKRIDANVVRLEKEILGRNEDDEYSDNEDDDDDIASFRADEFNKRVNQMTREMHERFDEMRRLLEASGISRDDD